MATVHPQSIVAFLGGTTIGVVPRAASAKPTITTECAVIARTVSKTV
jgi:hypothetical protein